jgi:hypothetical protein
MTASIDTPDCTVTVALRFAYDRDVVVAHNERIRDAFARVAKSARTHYIEANHDLSDMAEKDAPGFVDFVLS